MVMSAQSGNGAKMPFGLRKPQTTAERFCFNCAQWTIALVAILVAIGLVGLSLRFARWGLGGSW